MTASGMTSRGRADCRPRWRVGRAIPIGLALVVAGLGACGNDAPVTVNAPMSDQAQQGRTIAQRSGCTNCHTSDGRPSTGPTWKGIWGTRVTFVDGRAGTVDDAYIRRSIQDPASDALAGFASAMPKFSLTDEEIAAVTAYIRELTPPTEAAK